MNVPYFRIIAILLQKSLEEQLYGAILESFKTGQDVKFDTGTGKDTPDIAITVVPIEGDNVTKALARMTIDEGFVVTTFPLRKIRTESFSYLCRV